MSPRSDTIFSPLPHGGEVQLARLHFPGAPEPFLDLSTGINPYHYPLPRLTDDVFTRLPDSTALNSLAEIAARAYGVPSAACVACAGGTQILLPLVASLVPAGHAAVLGPTYQEHFRAARLAGHEVQEVSDTDRLGAAQLAIVVNPNNPDGRIVARSMLIDLAQELSRQDGLLVVDEAFVDVSQPDLSAADAIASVGNVIVLRSFGKFFGLPGLRLGFALAAPHLVRRLQASLGPWAVSGPAIHVATKALADEDWKTAMRRRLAESAARLDQLLKRAELEVLGGTSLFRLTSSANAQTVYEQLGRCGIVVRRFAEHPNWLRWGLPRTDADWQRLQAALGADGKLIE
jgi:cobalamin biosynthesis protein CobC